MCVPCAVWPAGPDGAPAHSPLWSYNTVTWASIILAATAEGNDVRRGRSAARYGTGMATLNEAARIAASLPEVVEGETRGQRSWSVNGKTFAWERAFSKADVKRF